MKNFVSLPYKYELNMKVTFFKAKELDSNVKATIHVSGRLGFNSNAQKKLDLESVRFVKIGQGEESDGILFLVTCHEEDIETFSIAKAGEYYYANTKALFDSIGIDYENQKVIYDISEVTFDGIKYFKLKPRFKERKKGDDE